MGLQFVVMVVAFLGAIVAVPYCYDHRMDDGVFIRCLLAFAGIPFILGIVQERAHRSVALTAAGLLLLCPLVYAITDPLAVEFERSRDTFFSGSFAVTVFVSTNWLISSLRGERWLLAVAALLSLALAALGVYVLLGLVMYLE